jgi:hypothetical protein
MRFFDDLYSFSRFYRKIQDTDNVRIGLCCQRAVPHGGASGEPALDSLQGFMYIGRWPDF